jgi:hypothetical protein
MRYIPLKPPVEGSCHHSQYLEFEVKAGKLLSKLKSELDAEERKRIIDSNSQVWGSLKAWLLTLSHQKCWFSEAKECFSYWEVEHFRPKKSAKDDLDGTIHDGYWWLAFDWRNFRVCGSVGNRKKGIYFPLRSGSTRVTTPNGDLRLEDHVLLDPADENDPSLLSFNVEGRAIPQPYIDNEWEQFRVTYSIERYNLDFPALMDQRKLVWQDCWNHIQNYREELARYSADRTNLIAKEAVKRKAGDIRNMLKADCAFASVARACLLSTGDERLRGLIQSD